jgi:hypothetical protein
MKTTKPNMVKDALCKAHIDTQKNNKLAFKLVNASVHGDELLISEPSKWSELESEYLVVGMKFSLNRHSCEGGNLQTLR